MPRTFEYKLLSSEDVESRGFFAERKRKDVEAYLNQLGSEGWEILGINFIGVAGTERAASFAALAKRER